jgi:hypothetical protein
MRLVALVLNFFISNHYYCSPRPPRHSREGGNPFGSGGSRGTMDSRLRGNDSVERIGYCISK